MSTDGGPQPGWYTDPQHAWQLRYWDGRSWTEHIAPLGPAAYGPAPMGAGMGPGLAVGVPPLPFPAVRAAFGRRALGYIVDLVVIGVPLLVLFFVAFFVLVASASSSGSSSGEHSGPSAAFFLVLLLLEGVLVVVPFLYNGYFTGGGRRTVGQRVAGLRVVDAQTGAPLSVGKAFLRTLVAAVASGQVFGLGYWWALWDREQRTWHDMASTSVVIDVRGAPPTPGW